MSDFDIHKFVRHLSQIQSETASVLDADFGAHFNLSQLGVHHLTLKPNTRSSIPHAESLEEEFVFVLSGEPHAWINGFLYPLKPGWALGFQAGTGIAHSLLNNTASDVHLFVVGERTLKENRFNYPANPELKSTVPQWWSDAPTQILGPHLGAPGPITSDSLRAPTELSFACYAPEIVNEKPFHYPGDNETFGAWVRLTDKVGLQKLGISLETLAAHRRSAFAHAHKIEEEFAFIIAGHPTLWINGYTKQLSPGDAVAFPAATGMAHCLINDTSEPVIYMGIGDARFQPEEKLTYPLNSLRIKECVRKGRYWLDAPEQVFGAHPGLTTKPFPEHLKLRLCTLDDAVEVLALFQSSPTYFEKVDGCQANDAITQEAISGQPPHPPQGYFKEFLLIEQYGETIGAVDLHANNPSTDIVYLGLLIVKESLMGRGLGTKCYRFIEDYAKRALGAKEIRLGVSDDHDVSRFWQSVGFQANGKVYTWQGHKKPTHVKEYSKLI